MNAGNKQAVKKKGKSLTKRITGWLHLWLGLVSGLIVFVVALTGTLFVFCDEIIQARAGDALYVKEVKEQRLSSEELIAAFKKQHPERTAFYFVAHKDPHRSFKVGSGVKNEDFQFTWMNPYTGESIKSDGAYWFFYVVAHIHSQLLAEKTGQAIVGIATIIFFIQLIGGLILWWPKKWNKNTRQAAFKIKSGTGWRRKNYDLHNVLGFYTLVPAIVITVTGLVMAYEPVGAAAQKLFGGNADGDKLMKKLMPKYEAGMAALPIDSIINRYFKTDDEIQEVRLTVPRNDSMAFYYSMRGSKLGLKSAEHGHFAIINKYNGKEVTLTKDLLRHEDIETWNLNIHMGHWYGLPAKIFTFIIGLVCISLPITGFLIWLGRKNKNKKGAATKTNAKALPKTAMIIAGLFFGNYSFAQDAISIGKRISIQSNILQEKRELLIYLPDSYNNGKYAPAKYPVVYLLDAESNFHSFTGLLQALSKGPYANAPQMIVVGIVNTDRTRDLTPTKSSREAFFEKGKTMFSNSGGGANFISFLEKELRPYIDSAYRTNGFNVLNGHSFGGLTATDILLNHTALFNAYIIIDPSLWWDNQLLVKQAEKLMPDKDFKQRNVYLAMAHKDIIPQDTTTDQERNILLFKSIAEKNHPKNLRMGFKYYKDEDHGTISIPAEIGGLKFIFDQHLVNVKQAIDSPAIVQQHFNQLSKQTGFSFFPSENWLDWMGNYCMSIDKKATAKIFYTMATKYYPHSKSALEKLNAAN